ncbi:GAF domain-containing protein [Streptomyces europaeiscabiei]|uniref:GAF domain-containing protein n=1 Tax=Streptomyces europaeiscabiei TaxID=146819 RepID=UPI0029A98583|nr:GAF domain-containing protein [Streptomyces europaeiscabiei]MDX2757317.1 GAF domain-containing protein [Streptomyces europaeiscabiei]
MNPHAPSDLLSTTSHDTDWQSHLPDLFDPMAPPVDAFDAFARQVADAADTPYAMLNWVGREQYFLGLANPADGELPVLGRTLPLTHGFCPHVVQRRGSLVLTDVLDFDAFAGNAVVDELGVRMYAGAPLIDERTNHVWGTVCVIDTEPRDRSDGRPLWTLIDHFRDLFMTELYRRTSS